MENQQFLYRHQQSYGCSADNSNKINIQFLIEVTFSLFNYNLRMVTRLGHNR